VTHSTSNDVKEMAVYANSSNVDEFFFLGYSDGTVQKYKVSDYLSVGTN